MTTGAGPPPQAQRIRSFVTREGRLTRGQRYNLAWLWPRYGLETTGHAPDWDAIFARRAPRTLEIGFGAGEVLTDLAVRCPDEDFIGVEVYRAGVGRALGALEAAGAANARLFLADAIDVLAACADAGLDEVLLYFPDPWPKKRHHKRRLVQPIFADAVARVLKPGGHWRLATDWADYAAHMRAVLDVHPAFANVGDAEGYVSCPPRGRTRFESRGRRRGHPVFDLAYRRRG